VFVSFKCLSDEPSYSSTFSRKMVWPLVWMFTRFTIMLPTVQESRPTQWNCFLVLHAIAKICIFVVSWYLNATSGLLRSIQPSDPPPDIVRFLSLRTPRMEVRCSHLIYAI
jgi:hypothetical protein